MAPNKSCKLKRLTNAKIDRFQKICDKKPHLKRCGDIDLVNMLLAEQEKYYLECPDREKKEKKDVKMKLALVPACKEARNFGAQVKRREKTCAKKPYLKKCGQEEVLILKEKYNKAKEVCDLNTPASRAKAVMAKNIITNLKDEFSIEDRKIVSKAYQSAKRMLNKNGVIADYDNLFNSTAGKLIEEGFERGYYEDEKPSKSYKKKKLSAKKIKAFKGMGLVGGCGPCMNCGYEADGLKEGVTYI